MRDGACLPEPAVGCPRDGRAMAHVSEGFYAFDDPVEAAVLYVLVELAKGSACRAGF